MNFHKLSKERSIGEIKVFRYFFDTHIRVFQLILDFIGCMFIDKLNRTFTRCLFNNIRKMLGAIEHSVGIVRNCTMRTIIRIDHLYEIAGNDHAAGQIR